MGNGTLVIHTPMKHQLDQREQQGGSDTDTMTRRLKNRERQRRYRARKRLEADMGKGSVAIQSDPSQPDMGKGHHHHPARYAPRVHCTRKWKKEARGRAHSATAMISGLASTDVHVNPSSLPGDELSKKPSLGRRNWKAEARKKKSQLS